MNSDWLAGQWTQLKGNVKEQWGKLTDDDLTEIDGKQEILLGKLQARYGLAKEKTEEDLEAFRRRF